MNRIHVLPESVVNQIAAGEVVERPASVVKELVENAIDAGARHVTVDVFEGGKRRIRVVDDGSGMSAEDLPLAFASHATSKIEGSGDLFRVKSLGFRGEALASIASVSRARIVTRERSAPGGHEITCDWGELRAVKPIGAPEGTTVEVEELFHRVPARRRFLKSDATEMAHVTEVVTRIALARPDVGFRLRHNDRDGLDLRAAERERERIEALFGGELGDVLLPVSARAGGLAVRGLAGAPSADRSRPDRQYVFLNGRFVRDRSLSHAIFAGYEGFLMSGRNAIAFLYLDVDPDEVDVNVHPTKIEVRIRPAREVHDLVVRAIREALVARGPGRSLTPEVTPRAVSEAPSWLVAPRGSEVRETPLFGASTPAIAAVAAPATATRRLLQIHSSFVLVETDDGFAVVDQHALHEGILHHRLKEKVRSGPLLSQRLLAPQVVTLPATERAALLEHAVALEPLGLLVEPFGEDAVAIQGVPALLRELDARPLVRELGAKLVAGEVVNDPAAILDAAIDMAACKGAVRAGDSLSSEKIEALLCESESLPSSYACAHGRPHTVKVTLREMERWFRRH
ncbi:MAG: DNA mismatch repair endonuclease MutL [Planctomycetes bacterium]|nr:DNA mismatch repair endonuclease MutL [Planctomycetota bacterium]